MRFIELKNSYLLLTKKLNWYFSFFKLKAFCVKLLNFRRVTGVFNVFKNVECNAKFLKVILELGRFK